MKRQGIRAAFGVLACVASFALGARAQQSTPAPPTAAAAAAASAAGPAAPAPGAVGATRPFGAVPAHQAFAPAQDPPEALQGGVHAGLACAACHFEAPPGLKLPPTGTPVKRPGKASCAGCHEKENLTYRASRHGQQYAAADPDSPYCWTCHGRHRVQSPSREGLEFKRQIVRVCLGCHTDERLAARHKLPSAAIIVAYQYSVHGQAVLSDKAMTDKRAPICSDCHGSHSAHRIGEQASAEDKVLIENICGNADCHGDIKGAYQGSIHWKALSNGNFESPTCTSCHGEHSILAQTDPRSFVGPIRVTKTCSACHETMGISNKFKIPTNRLATYSKSVHGIFSSKGDLRVANCASCHGAHDILPSSDSRSMINSANLQKTCGHCHPGDVKRFTDATFHENPTDTWSVIQRYGNNLDLWLAAFVGLFLAAYFVVFVFIVVSRRRESVP